jgi:DNA-binding protein Fis
MKTAMLASGFATPATGDPSALVSQLGLPAGPDEASTSGIAGMAWNDLAGFRDELVCRLEWPAIIRASELARSGHHRELLELDRNFGRELPAHLAKASCCVGRSQLARLRALRDQRSIQRYLDAIEGGEAKGWNPVVYGVVLAVFGIPLRQGVMHYATAVLHSRLVAVFGDGSAADVRLENLLSPLPEAANALLGPGSTPSVAK